MSGRRRLIKQESSNFPPFPTESVIENMTIPDSELHHRENRESIDPDLIYRDDFKDRHFDLAPFKHPHRAESKYNLPSSPVMTFLINALLVMVLVLLSLLIVYSIVYVSYLIYLQFSFIVGPKQPICTYTGNVPSTTTTTSVND